MNVDIIKLCGIHLSFVIFNLGDNVVTELIKVKYVQRTPYYPNIYLSKDEYFLRTMKSYEREISNL